MTKTADLHDQFNRLFVMLKEAQRDVYNHENPWEQAFKYALLEIQQNKQRAQTLYEEYKALGLSVNTIEAEGNLRGWASALETMEFCLSEAENKQ